VSEVLEVVVVGGEFGVTVAVGGPADVCPRLCELPVTYPRLAVERGHRGGTEAGELVGHGLVVVLQGGDGADRNVASHEALVPDLTRFGTNASAVPGARFPGHPARIFDAGGDLIRTIPDHMTPTQPARNTGILSTLAGGFASQARQDSANPRGN
jgi:hypothetical protein